MSKKKVKKNKHNSYKYIIGFCSAFIVLNFFVEKLANKYEGKNNPQITNTRFDETQGQFSEREISLVSKKNKNKDLKKLPIHKRKQQFISNLLPVAQSANNDILEKRELFFKIEKKIQNNNLNVLEASILKKMFKEYKVKNNDLSELKKRIDIVPISLVLAQAAIESGWGTSRFAIEGNAYFGQKIIGSKVNGISPIESKNPLHKDLSSFYQEWNLAVTVCIHVEDLQRLFQLNQSLQAYPGTSLQFCHKPGLQLSGHA